MSLIIRHADEQDMPAVLAIYNASIATGLSTTDVEPISLEQRLLSFRQHEPDRRPFWVAEREGAGVIGYCSLRDFYGRPAYAPTAEIAVYVDERHQGEGVGSALLSHAVQQCERLGIRTLIAFVFTANEASMRLFERFGFERWGTLPNIANLRGRWMEVAILGHQR